MLTPAQNANEVAGKPLSSRSPTADSGKPLNRWCPSVSPEGLITVGRVVWMMLDPLRLPLHHPDVARRFSQIEEQLVGSQ